MRYTLSLVTLGLASTVVGLAHAQPPPPVPVYYVAERPPAGQLAAPRNAFELSVATGYTQGFGNLTSNVGLPSVATPGVAFDLGLGYRIDPRWAVLWSGEYAELTAERTNAARSFTSGLAVQYHLAPLQRVDPWVELGIGYRFVVEDSTIGPTLVTHGPQLGRARAGIDFRLDETFALGPMIGADATIFYFQDTENFQTTLPNPTISTFLFAGVTGRFDIGQSTRSRRASVVVGSASQNR